MTYDIAKKIDNYSVYRRLGNNFCLYGGQGKTLNFGSDNDCYNQTYMSRHIVVCVISNGSDQPEQSLIRAFASCLNIL